MKVNILFAFFLAYVSFFGIIDNVSADGVAKVPTIKFNPAQRLSQGIQLDIPNFLPVHDVPMGKYAIKKGVIVFNNPTGKYSKAIYAGLPSNIADRLSDSTASLLKNESTPETVFAAKVESAKILADWYGVGLSLSNRNKLVENYAGVVTRINKIKTSLAAKQITYDQAIDAQASQIASMVINELKLLKTSPAAMKKRYVRSFSSMQKITTDRKLQDALVIMYRSFIKGKYIAKDKEVIARFQDRFQRGDIQSSLDLNFFNDKIFPSINTKQLCRIIQCNEAYQRVDLDPITLGWEVRVYSSEHLVDIVLPDYIEILKMLHPSLDWEGMFVDWGFVHTSILVGLWNTTKQYFDIFKIDTKKHRIIEHKQYTQYGDNFNEWMVANGASSWIKKEDTLHLAATATFSSRSDAEKWAYGTIEVGGEAKNIRGCAYPSGLYGIDWVCHQNANAFALRRWNIIPVNYPHFTAVYGSFGAQKVPPIVSSWADPSANGRRIHNGGIPGKYLYYNTTSPHEHGLSNWPLKPILRGLDGMLTPDGYHLSHGVDEETGNILDYKCAYDEAEIPFDGRGHIFNVVEGRQ